MPKAETQRVNSDIKIFLLVWYNILYVMVGEHILYFREYILIKTAPFTTQFLLEKPYILPNPHGC